MSWNYPNGNTATTGGWTSTPWLSTTGAGTYSVVTGTASPYSTTLTAQDINLEGLGSVRGLFENFRYLMPPSDMDLDNPTVRDAYDNWIKSLDRVRLAHSVLESMIALTKPNE